MACVSPGEPKAGNFTWSSVGRVELMSVPPSHQILQTLALASLRDSVSVRYFRCGLDGQAVIRLVVTQGITQGIAAGVTECIFVTAFHEPLLTISDFSVYIDGGRDVDWAVNLRGRMGLSFELLAKQPRLRPSHHFQMIRTENR